MATIGESEYSRSWIDSSVSARTTSPAWLSFVPTKGSARVSDSRRVPISAVGRGHGALMSAWIEGGGKLDDALEVKP
jgi:hypothetical protein